MVNLEVNSQIPIVKGWRKWLTQAGDVSNDAARADVDDVSNDISKRVECVGLMINRTETLSDVWGRVRSPTVSRLSQFCRSTLDDLCGTFNTVIGATFVAMLQTAVVCAVWNSLTMAAVGLEPKDDGWMMSEVQRRKAAAVVVMAEAMLKKESH